MAHVEFRGLVRVGALTAAVVALPVFAAAQSAKPAPTFTKDVATIFQEKCESCHRPDSIAPMSLVTYEETRPWARSIKNRVAARQMPPWHIDKTVGIQHFQNDRSLSDEQIDTIVRWVDAGAPKGDIKDMPPAIKWADDNVWNFAPHLRWTSRSGRQVDAVHAESQGAGRVVQAGRCDGAHRGALGARHRNPPGDRQRPQGHPPRARASAADRTRSAGNSPSLGAWSR